MSRADPGGEHVRGRERSDVMNSFGGPESRLCAAGVLIDCSRLTPIITNG